MRLCKWGVLQNSGGDQLHGSSVPAWRRDVWIKGTKLAGICGFPEPRPAVVQTTCSWQRELESRGVWIISGLENSYCLMVNPCYLEHGWSNLHLPLTLDGGRIKMCADVTRGGRAELLPISVNVLLFFKTEARSSETSLNLWINHLLLSFCSPPTKTKIRMRLLLLVAAGCLLCLVLMGALLYNPPKIHSRCRL